LTEKIQYRFKKARNQDRASRHSKVVQKDEGGRAGEGRYTYPFTTKFQDDVNIVSVIEEAVKTNNVPVIQGLMNRDFLRHFLSLIAFRH